MSDNKSLELRVSVDVGYRRYRVAMGFSDGGVLEEFEIEHRIEGFEDFFSRIEKQRKANNCSVAVAMAGGRGTVRPGSPISSGAHFGPGDLRMDAAAQAEVRWR